MQFISIHKWDCDVVPLLRLVVALLLTSHYTNPLQSTGAYDPPIHWHLRLSSHRPLLLHPLELVVMWPLLSLCHQQSLSMA